MVGLKGPHRETLQTKTLRTLIKGSEASFASLANSLLRRLVLYLDRHIGRMLQRPAACRDHNRVARLCWLQRNRAYGSASGQAHDCTQAQHSQHDGCTELRDPS